MKKIALLIILCLGLLVSAGCKKPPVKAVYSEDPIIVHHERSQLPVWNPNYQTATAVLTYSGEPEADEMVGLQCPIPMQDRVRNHTGTQCVFSSLECLARWGGVKQLLEPNPLTSRPGCRSFSGPSDAAQKLKQFGVKFEDSYSTKEAGVKLIKKAMAEGRGCLWGIPGHAMVICHFDEEKKVMKYIDNSDSSLRIHTASLDKFYSMWDRWVIVIYPEQDTNPYILERVENWPNMIPIIDHNNPQAKYPKNYIPMPRK